MSFEEYIYESTQGTLRNPHPEVTDLFAAGKPCERWYAEMMEAYGRICTRLGAGEEDDDLEIIVNNFLRIQQEVAIEMYRYGAKFGQ